MKPPIRHVPDPDRDLFIERVVDVPPRLVWRAWTEPEHLKRWFTPRPWQTTEVELDLRPGGVFRTVMRGPDGPEHTNLWCVLEVVEHEKFVWTGAMEPGFRPRSLRATGGRDELPFLMTAVITMEAHGAGTRYRALAIHSDPEGCATHAGLGFYDGWGTVTDQLFELVRGW